MKSIKETILEKIKNEKLEQRPKLYFTLKIVLLAVLSLAILAITIFIFNFIFFSIRLNSQDELLGFGPRGVLAFLWFFPWSWFILDLIFIAFLQSLLRKFQFGYRVPVVYLLGGLILVTLLVAYVFDRGSHLNERILIRAEGHHLPPPFEMVYHGARRPVSPRNGICRCTVVDIFQNQMVVADNRFGTTTLFNVILPENNPRATSTSLQKGDTVFIAGELKDGVIQAFGVKKVQDIDR
jgi:hypothetical protein